MPSALLPSNLMLPPTDRPRSKASRRRRRLKKLKNVPVLPSLVTLGNLFFGFLAIAKIADGAAAGIVEGLDATLVLLDVAVKLVFVAMVFDALDGGVARITNQATKFGAQLDSLADMVTFGVAPAFMMKVLVETHAQGENALLPSHPKLYYVCAAIYVLCAALRLARFNVETTTSSKDHREFRGLPSPAAAALLCAMVAFYSTRNDQDAVLTHFLLPEGVYDAVLYAMPVGLIVTGLLMVSRVPFPHLAYALIQGRESFPFLASLVVLIGVAAVEWQFALAAIALLYVFAGLGLGLFRILTTGSLERADDDDEDDDEDEDDEDEDDEDEDDEDDDDDDDEDKIVDGDPSTVGASTRTDHDGSLPGRLSRSRPSHN